MHLLFCAHLINIFFYFGLLNLDIFPSEMLRGCLVCVISFLYIQTLHFDCSHIEHVHPIFCAHLIIYFGELNLDIIMSTLIMSTPPLEYLLCVICV